MAVLKFLVVLLFLQIHPSRPCMLVSYVEGAKEEDFCSKLKLQIEPETCRKLEILIEPETCRKLEEIQTELEACRQREEIQTKLETRNEPEDYRAAYPLDMIDKLAPKKLYLNTKSDDLLEVFCANVDKELCREAVGLLQRLKRKKAELERLERYEQGQLEKAKLEKMRQAGEELPLEAKLVDDPWEVACAVDDDKLCREETRKDIKSKKSEIKRLKLKLQSLKDSKREVVNNIREKLPLVMKFNDHGVLVVACAIDHKTWCANSLLYSLKLKKAEVVRLKKSVECVGRAKTETMNQTKEDPPHDEDDPLVVACTDDHEESCREADLRKLKLRKAEIKLLKRMLSNLEDWTVIDKMTYSHSGRFERAAKKKRQEKAEEKVMTDDDVFLDSTVKKQRPETAYQTLTDDEIILYDIIGKEKTILNMLHDIVNQTANLLQKLEESLDKRIALLKQGA